MVLERGCDIVGEHLGFGPMQPLPVFAEDFSSEKSSAAALEEYDRLQASCQGLKDIQDDLGKMVDAFVDFLLAVPAMDGEDALTSAMNWKFNPRLAFLCLQRGLALASDFGKYAYQHLADWSSHVYVRWLAIYQSGFNVPVASQHNTVSMAEVAATDHNVFSKTKRRWARRCDFEPYARVPQLPDCLDGDSFEVAVSKTSCRWTRKPSSKHVHAPLNIRKPHAESLDSTQPLGRALRDLRTTLGTESVWALKRPPTLPPSRMSCHARVKTCSFDEGLLCACVMGMIDICRWPYYFSWKELATANG